MLVLTAEGGSPGKTKSWNVMADAALTLGRSEMADCPVMWDELVSQEHAEVRINEAELNVRCLPGSRSPIWKDGQTHFEASVSHGESFRIGRTWFTASNRDQTKYALKIIDEEPVQPGHTTSVLMNPADVRLNVVSRSAASLWTTADEKELAERALEILHQVLHFAELLVVISCKDVEAASRPKIVHWHKNKSGVRASVSRQLIAKAIGEGETAIEVETNQLGEPVSQGRWSFCVPVKSDDSTPWCIYIGGTFGKASDYGPYLQPRMLQADAEVTELVSHLIGAVRSVRTVENRFDGVRQFFSPKLLEKITSGNVENNMAPRETDVVAIYCDLRGFSRMVSESSDDLHGLLNRVSAALGIMTSSITEHQGVIADFQGDSALGFWGWPIALADGPLAACRAALQIQRIFRMAAAENNRDLNSFQVGIGIATGRAIAGRIGTQDHAKIGVFGPVVNIASRLEGLTKKTGASILMDHGTAVAVRNHLSADEGRCRPIGKLQPAGFDEPIDVSELLPPETESVISDGDIKNFTAAVEAFKKGEWDRSRKLLGLMPADDRTRDFLLVQIAQQNYQPPASWDGTIKLDSK